MCRLRARFAATHRGISGEKGVSPGGDFSGQAEIFPLQV